MFKKILSFSSIGLLVVVAACSFESQDKATGATQPDSAVAAPVAEAPAEQPAAAPTEAPAEQPAPAAE